MKVSSGKLPEMAERETEETCTEHISVMKKEMKKTTNRKMALIKNLMELTYSHRRQSILLQPTAIDDVVSRTLEHSGEIKSWRPCLARVNNIK